MALGTEGEDQVKGFADLGGDENVVETDSFRLAASNEYFVVGDRWMPTWIEFETDGFDEPNQYCRVEIRDGAPRLVELGWRARDHQREIRQKDLRGTEVAAIIDVLYAMYVIELRDGEPVLNLGNAGTDQDRRVRDSLFSLRLNHGRRVITTEFLQQVADVYRTHIDHAPTEAVARAFGVRSRQASGYVQKARARGFLPATKQGKKKA